MSLPALFRSLRLLLPLVGLMVAVPAAQLTAANRPQVFFYSATVLAANRAALARGDAYLSPALADCAGTPTRR